MTSETESGMQNVAPEAGERTTSEDNAFGLTGLDHIALPTQNYAVMERFIREILGGEPLWYAGFSTADKDTRRVAHIFLRVGRVVIQCAEPESGEMMFRKDDPDIVPHFAFGTSADDLDRNIERLRSHKIPVAGPYRRTNIGLTSIHFQSPEGHKLEICTWDPYPEDKAGIMGAPGVGHVDWPALAHSWPDV